MGRWMEEDKEKRGRRRIGKTENLALGRKKIKNKKWGGAAVDGQKGKNKAVLVHCIFGGGEVWFGE